MPFSDNEMLRENLTLVFADGLQLKRMIQNFRLTRHPESRESKVMSITEGRRKDQSQGISDQIVRCPAIDFLHQGIDFFDHAFLVRSHEW